MLTDGVLIMQHTNDETHVLLINPSLKKIFGRKTGIGQQQTTKYHTCPKHRMLEQEEAKSSIPGGC